MSGALEQTAPAKTGFFAVDRRIWAKLCVPGMMNEAVAYIVQARGTGRDNRTTTWSVESVERYTGISRHRAAAAVKNLQQVGSWGWTHEGEDEPHATVGYEADLTDRKTAWLRLHYQSRGEQVDYRVRLVTTTPTYGGLRWWFICPLVRRDGGPLRRVAKLYLPPGSRYFGSREGHGLTYTSCRESGKFRRLSSPRCRNGDR